MNTSIFNKSNELDEQQESVVSQIIAGIMGCLAIIGNVVSIVALFIQRHKMTKAYKLIANLSFSDLFTGIAVLSFAPLLGYKSLIENEVICSSVYAYLLFGSSASVNALLLVTIDRYLIIVWPLHYQTLTSSPKTEIAVAVGWGLALVFSTLPVVNIFGRRNLVDTSCQLGNIFTTDYIVFIFCVEYAIPLFLMLLMYVRIGVIARKHQRQIASLQISDASSTQQETVASVSGPVESTATDQNCRKTLAKKARTKEQWKATKTILIILGYFIVSWLPFYTLMLLTSSSPHLGPRVENVEVIAYMLAYTNPVINPIIYVLRVPELKRTIINLIRHHQN